MRVMFSCPAPEQTVFGTAAFDAQIGKPVDIKMLNGHTVTGALVDVDLIDGGKTAQLALEVPDDSPMHTSTPSPPVSVDE